MNWHFLFLVAAFIVFCIAALAPSSRVNLTDVGLALLTLALLIG